MTAADFLKLNEDQWHQDLILSPRTDAYSVKFFPFAAFGGALWATGNCMSVPIINSIGLSMGLLIWGAANMLMGWAIGKFGLFDLTENTLSHEGLNYAGVGHSGAHRPTGIFDPAAM